MDLITVVIISVIVAATGVINPKPKDPETVAKAPETQVTTPVVAVSYTHLTLPTICSV